MKIKKLLSALLCTLMLGIMIPVSASALDNPVSKTVLEDTTSEISPGKIDEDGDNVCLRDDTCPITPFTDTGLISDIGTAEIH